MSWARRVRAEWLRADIQRGVVLRFVNVGPQLLALARRTPGLGDRFG